MTYLMQEQEMTLLPVEQEMTPLTVEVEMIQLSSRGIRLITPLPKLAMRDIKLLIIEGLKGQTR